MCSVGLAAQSQCEQTLDKTLNRWHQPVGGCIAGSVWHCSQEDLEIIEMDRHSRS